MLVILQGFSVFAPRSKRRGKGEERVRFGAGMVIEEKDIPPGQSAEDWIEKGLAKRADETATG